MNIQGATDCRVECCDPVPKVTLARHPYKQGVHAWQFEHSKRQNYPLSSSSSTSAVAVDFVATVTPFFCRVDHWNRIENLRGTFQSYVAILTMSSTPPVMR